MDEPISPHNLVIYVNLEVQSDRTGKTIDVPGLVYDGTVLFSLVDYFVHKSRSHSLAWMMKVRAAVNLFLKYSLVNTPMGGFGVPGSRSIDKAQHREHFAAFSRAVLLGTFDPLTGVDQCGLCWASAGPKKMNRVITDLTEFFEWIVRTSYDAPAADSPLNPRAAGSAHDQIMAQAAYEHRRSKAFLGHTWSPTLPAGSLHFVNRIPQVKTFSLSPPAFPEGALDRLLMHGYHVSGRRNWRDMLIVLLLDGAGFRESEPMHLFIEDVCEDPARSGSALVRIYHPTYGAAPESWRDMNGRHIRGNRRDYLAQCFGLKPRNEIIGKLHAGWKGGTHENSKKLYKQAYWFRPEYGILFLKLWKRYLLQVQRTTRNHPYAFVNLYRDPGAPYRLRCFLDAHRAAVGRASLVPAEHCSLKELGLTPHGHRHAYAQRLKRAGVHERLIKLFMHHAAIESQETYTQPSIGEVRMDLDAAASRLQESTFDFNKYNFESQID